jgi:hypothetical protein
MQVARDNGMSVNGRNEEPKVIPEANRTLVDASSGAVEQSSLGLVQPSLRPRASLKSDEVVSKESRESARERESPTPMLQ